MEIEKEVKLMEEKREQGPTYGTGEQYVLEPADGVEAQKAKVRPQQELPEKLVTEDGRLVNLDTGSVNPTPKLVNLCGRQVDLDEFGPKGEGFVRELYEQWLGSVQNNQVSTFSTLDEDWVDSTRVLDLVDTRHRALKGRVVWRTEPSGIRRGVFKWDQTSTFDEWMALTAATLRWRIGYEVERRRITQALSAEDIQQAKHLAEECLIVIEKWQHLPEAKQLISV